MRTAALLAAVGTILLSALLLFDLIEAISGVLRGLIPAVAIFRAFIYAFAAITAAIFFFTFYKRQS